MYCGIFLTVLGIILNFYFLSELMLHLNEGIFQGWGAIYFNLLIFNAAGIIFPGISLIFICIKKRKRFFEKPKINEVDFTYLKNLIYNYLTQNQNKALISLYSTNSRNRQVAQILKKVAYCG